MLNGTKIQKERQIINLFGGLNFVVEDTCCSGVLGSPVYFENRDGNMNVMTKQEEFLEWCYQMLLGHKIYLDRSHLDARPYSKKMA